ncbi:MAG TPA: hypothetical protein VK348_11365 [Planctomycetota bacterium]|nr:hypothetical protein [Planctomycetota bacterium]
MDQPQRAATPADRDLLVVFPLSNHSMGTADERSAIERLADQLEVTVQAAAAGEYDGDEIGGGQCTLFFSGADVDRLAAVLRPLLQRSDLGRRAIVRAE